MFTHGLNRVRPTTQWQKARLAIEGVWLWTPVAAISFVPSTVPQFTQLINDYLAVVEIWNMRVTFAQYLLCGGILSTKSQVDIGINWSAKDWSVQLTGHHLYLFINACDYRTLAGLPGFARDSCIFSRQIYFPKCWPHTELQTQPPLGF